MMRFHSNSKFRACPVHALRRVWVGCQALRPRAWDLSGRMVPAGDLERRSTGSPKFLMQSKLRIEQLTLRWISFDPLSFYEKRRALYYLEVISKPNVNHT